MTTDVDCNYRGVYTYDNTGEDLISEQDLGHVEGVPNNPLYYVKDAIGSVTAITNMNGEIIDSNRFAPYGEALDPVAKNARLTNSPFGFTGETHDIEGGLVYLRARYYEPDTMRFIQQDTYLGDTRNPITRNLYAYAVDNPVKYTDPSGHDIGGKQTWVIDAKNGIWSMNLANHVADYYLSYIDSQGFKESIEPLVDRATYLDALKYIKKNAVNATKTPGTNIKLSLLPSNYTEWPVSKEMKIKVTGTYSKMLTLNISGASKDIRLNRNPSGKEEFSFTPMITGDYVVTAIADYDPVKINKVKFKVSKEGAGKPVLTEEQMLLIKTVYGEAANCSEASWEAIANVIMNRVGIREWKKYGTVTKVIKNSGFDAYTNPNAPYKTAEKYLNSRDGSNAKLEKLISIVLDVYSGKAKDNTNGAVLYYSPKAQAALHKKFPKLYHSLVPPWVNNIVEEVKVPGTEKDDFKFYKYK